MIRYNKTIQVKRTASGAYTITGDRMAVSYKTSAISGHELIRVWWERQHQSELREYQKDLLIKLLPSAFKRIDWSWNLTPCVVYADGAGYNQPHDLAFAHLDNPGESSRIYILGTQEHTWIHREPREKDQFSLHVEDAAPSVAVDLGRNFVWDLHDDLIAATHTE